MQLIYINSANIPTFNSNTKLIPELDPNAVKQFAVITFQLARIKNLRALASNSEIAMTEKTPKKNHQQTSL